MAIRSKKKVSPKEKIIETIKKVIFSSQGFPIFLTLSVIAIMFVLFRMRGIELDYEIAHARNDIKKVQQENKELSARKARLLSPKRLRKLAKKYNLAEPKQDQIIVVP